MARNDRETKNVDTQVRRTATLVAWFAGPLWPNDLDMQEQQKMQKHSLSGHGTLGREPFGLMSFVQTCTNL